MDKLTIEKLFSHVYIYKKILLRPLYVFITRKTLYIYLYI